MSEITLGFTGTRGALTRIQVYQLEDAIEDPALRELHHGDCIGADATAHMIAEAVGITTIAHPPSDPKARAWCPADHIHEPKPYHDRNRDIVAACDWLLAMPNGPERKGSGTWWTINHAIEVGRNALIVYPDGAFELRAP